MRRLIVNADDFGYTSGINRAIIDAHKAGTLSSTTILVNGIAAVQAAALSRENRHLGVGLHVNLTSGAPILPAAAVPTLVDPWGNFYDVAKALFRLSVGLARGAEVEAEVRAQLKRCRELGIEPTHVDSHHHLHAHPRLRAIITRICNDEGIAKARGYRMGIRSPKSLAIRLADAVPVGKKQLRIPERFSGIEVMGLRDMASDLSRELAPEGDTLEFMCHPGYADEELRRATSYNDLRQVELESIMSEEFAAAIEQSDAELISFREF